MLEHLRDLRDNWSDEIPVEMVHYGEYKVRQHWFTGVVADVANMLSRGDIKTIEGIEAGQQLVALYKRDEFINRDLTTAEDIQIANSLIDIILGN